MNFKSSVIAAALLVLGSAASATTFTFDEFGTAKFKSDAFTAAGSFSQTITFDGLAAGRYTVIGDISSTYLSGLWAAVDSNKFVINADGRTGTLEYDGTEPLQLVVTGSVDSGTFKIGSKTFDKYKAANFSGSLTVTQAVPEPETYALMLAGLGAVGFVARRRKAA